MTFWPIGNNLAYSMHTQQQCHKGTAQLTRTSFSESPLHLLTMEEAEMLKKVVRHSVATAFANSVFPVPAGNRQKRARSEEVDQMHTTTLPYLVL